MDSGPGQCWVCEAPGKIWCTGCRFAYYCSLACQKKDKGRHLDECVNSSRQRVYCSYCGRDETLGGVPCTECLVCVYCTDSCRKMDAKNHRPICQKAKEKVLEAAKKIGDWNRRAKGIPQYMGRLIHAVDYLRWSENEGVKAPGSTDESTRQKRVEEYHQRESGRSRMSNSKENPEKEEEPLRLLMLGADLKHVLRTLHDTPDSCSQGIDFTLVDSSPHIMARDLLVLYLLMLPDAPTPLQDQTMLKTHAEKVVMIFYALSLDMETHALLCNTLHNLLNMTYKSFLHEMRQQVYIDAASYSLVQAVWSGWMSFANDPGAMQKLEKIRMLKMSGKVVKDVLSRYVKSCPKEYQKAISDWIKRGSLKKQKGGHFPNVTLACFSPLKKEHLERFEDVNPKWSEETEWIKGVSPEDDMIYAPHGIDMVFQDWDFVWVSKYAKKESNVIEMYLKFLTQVFKKSSQKLLKSNQISLRFVRANLKDVRRIPLLLKGKFDRIATGIHADLLGTPFVLQELGGFLRTDSSCARLITHHRVWSLCLNWQSDLQAREMCQKCIKASKPPDPVLMLSARWATFRHFLQAELLHHLHKLDGRPVELDNVLTFRDVSHSYDMLLSDYSHYLNKIVPFRFRPEKRMVSMVDSRLHTLEWRRVGRTRRTSAPAATYPKSLPSSQSPEVDPASRYVDNLITLSRSSPMPSPTNSDSRPGSRLCSREGSLSPCPPEHMTSKEDRNSRSRATNRPRPRSLYVSTRCKSPLLSSEFDFWEQQNLIKEKNKPTSIKYNEIPEGIKSRAQQSLEAELSQTKLKAKSAPASPQAKCKSRMVKEKANAFERGSASRSSFPETRKHIDAITPTTPVKKLVMMFSKAFSAKEKDAEMMRPLKRSSSFHGRRASFEQDEQKHSPPKEYTNSLKINRSTKSQNLIESGTNTFPRKSRPHSIAVSKFSYLEGCIEKRVDAINNATKETVNKKEAKRPATLIIPDNHRKKKGHISPIRNLIAGLNTLSVSPVMPRAAKPQNKTLKDTISIKRDELKLVNIRPGSPRLPSPASGSPAFEGVEAIDWPERSLGKSSKRTPTDSPRKPPSDSPRITSIDNPRKTPTNSPQVKRSVSSKGSPSPTPSSSIPKMFSNFRKSFKKIPNEPEYEAPPLYISKSPLFMLQSPSSDNSERRIHHSESHSETNTKVFIAGSYTEDQSFKLEDIFSPKPSPTQSLTNLHQTSKKERKGGLAIQTIQPDIENVDFEKGMADSMSLPKTYEKSKNGSRQEAADSEIVEKMEVISSKVKEYLSPKELLAISSASMSTSLTEADKEVSDLFSHEESFSPITPETGLDTKNDNYEQKVDEESVSSECDYTANKEERTNKNSNPATDEAADDIDSAMNKIDRNDENQTQTQQSESAVVPESPNTFEIQIQSNSQTSDDLASSHIDEQSSSPVYKMVERFAQRIQSEQQLIERPASPKGYNVMKRKSWSAAEKEQALPAKENEGENGNRNQSKITVDTEVGIVSKAKFLDADHELRKSIGDVNSPTGHPAVIKKIHEKESEKKVNVVADSFSSISVRNTPSPRQTGSQRSTPVKDRSVTPVTKMLEKLAIHNEAVQGRDKEKKLKETIEECSNTSVRNTPSPRQSGSQRSTPVKDLSAATPVNKMIEKFALQIQAQTLPPSPRSPRPHSIGTLIQQDFLRLYCDNLTGEDNRPEEDIQENVSLVSDCCEETMFDISDEEEQKTGDIGFDGKEKVLSKSEIKSLENIALKSAQQTSQKISEKDEKKAETGLSTPSEISERKSRPDVPAKMRVKKSTANTSNSPTRESRCDELRHEFLQKIRGINDSPIPPSKKKYGEIKATLSKVKKDMLQGEKMFTDDINNSKAFTSSPRLEDMAIVSYTIKIDSDSITEQLRTPPITPRDDPGGAICLLADKESHGFDGDSQELCSNEYKKFDDILSRSTSRNSSPAQHSPRFHTLPRKSKSSYVESPTSSLKRSKGKNKVVGTDISQHKVQMLKSSRTGGMDKMSFRHFVKTSIANEDSVVKQSENIIDNEFQVIEYTSSVEVSNEELESNPEYVEEAIEAISFTSEEDEPPTLPKKKFTHYNTDTPDSDSENGSKHHASKTQNVRRKRLPSSRSPSDLKHQEGTRYYVPSPKADDSDNAEDDNENVRGSKPLRHNYIQTVITRQTEHYRLSPLGTSLSDDARQSPDGLDFKVEIPDTPIDSSRDIRRFMWGSLKKKKKKHSSSKSKKDYRQEEIHNSGSEFEGSRLTPERLKGPAFKLIFDKKKSMSDEDFLLSNELLDSPISETKSGQGHEEPVKSNNTTPTIVAMVPKHRETGSPIVGYRLSRERAKPHAKSPPPKAPPKPKKKDISIVTSLSTNDITQAGKPSFEEVGKNRPKCVSPTERPRSWAGVESSDILASKTSEGSPLPSRCTSILRSEVEIPVHSSPIDDNEVFRDDTPVNSEITPQANTEEKVEVRPRAGVLKNSRDRSRDSRRSLRVSWGDLPERVDSPSPPADYDGDEQDEEQQQDSDEPQQDDEEEINTEAFSSTQL